MKILWQFIVLTNSHIYIYIYKIKKELSEWYYQQKKKKKKKKEEGQWAVQIEQTKK